jgi:hypothetical protein
MENYFILHSSANMKVPLCKHESAVLRMKLMNLGWYWVQVLISSEKIGHFILLPSGALCFVKNISFQLLRSRSVDSELK